MTEQINVDYLVVGAGAMGMAFVDTLLTDTKATVAIVDRYDKPGGHWTIAYPYVRLHQPSHFYGVNSRQLGQNSIDHAGWNSGLMELASRDEVCSYYDVVLRQTFLPSGRVQYFPKHEYVGEGEFHSQLTGKRCAVGKETRIVDATFMKVKVPAMGPPAYKVADGVALITPNELANLNRPYDNYTIVGAGKTGIDACLWLLAKGVNPSKITWVMPRDSFFLVRDKVQPGPLFAESRRATRENTNNSIMQATSVEDLLNRQVACDYLRRLDDNVWPTMYRCATVSLKEFEHLKAIASIIRKGRVLSIAPYEVVLEKGTYKSAADTVYIDCSADALAKLSPVPVFKGNTITLQSVRYCQQVFSAAFIPHIEASYDDEQLKNQMCRPIPHPYESMDYLIILLLTHRNSLQWATQPKTAAWLRESRLDWFGIFAPQPPEDPELKPAFYAGMKQKVEAVCAKLEKLLLEQSPEETGRARAQI